MNTRGVTFFGREPALFLGLFAIVVQVVSAFVVDVSPDIQAVVNALAVAVAGLIVAIVAHDALGAFVLGLIQAVVALAVGFGLDWSADKQALIMSLAAAVIAAFTRTQVKAPVSQGAPAGRLV